MYIWTAIDVDDQYDCLKKRVKLAGDNLCLACLDLPLHISLKISFQIDDVKFESVSKELGNFFKHISPFEIEPTHIEKFGNIVWVRYAQNARLLQIKSALDSMLKEKFSVETHKFDLEFIFHSTLFMDSDDEKLNSAIEYVKDFVLPKRVNVSKFIIGGSKTGDAVDYSVFEVISVK